MAVILLSWASLPLRLIIGLMFAPRGYQKLKGLKGTTGMLKNLGFVPASFWAFVLGVTELLAGLAIFFGLFTRIAAAFLLVSMLVALFLQIFVWKKKFQGGYELDLL